MKRCRPTAGEVKFLMIAAMGKVPADLVVQHADPVNVYTGEVLEDMSVCVKDRWLAYVGKAALVLIGTDTGSRLAVLCPHRRGRDFSTGSTVRHNLRTPQDRSTRRFRRCRVLKLSKGQQESRSGKRGLSW
jgi:hypothetical protein